MAHFISSCKSCGKTYFTPRLICGLCGETHFTEKPRSQADVVASTILFRQPGEILKDPITIMLMRTDDGSYFLQRLSFPS